MTLACFICHVLVGLVLGVAAVLGIALLAWWLEFWLRGRRRRSPKHPG